MTARYRIFPVVFDAQRWADVMRSIGPNDVADFAAVIGCAPGTISAWRSLGNDGKHQFPSMTMFISACNALDLNPNDFFVLDESGEK